MVKHWPAEGETHPQSFSNLLLHWGIITPLSLSLIVLNGSSLGSCKQVKDIHLCDLKSWQHADSKVVSTCVFSLGLFTTINSMAGILFTKAIIYLSFGTSTKSLLFSLSLDDRFIYCTCYTPVYLTTIYSEKVGMFLYKKKKTYPSSKALFRLQHKSDLFGKSDQDPISLTGSPHYTCCKWSDPICMFPSSMSHLHWFLW